MVTLVIAAMPGATVRAAKVVGQLGGTIRYRDDVVDYLRVRIPVDSVDRLVRDGSVHSVDVSISRSSRALGLAGQSAGAAQPDRSSLPTVSLDTIKGQWPPVLPETPLTNRYDPV